MKKLALCLLVLLLAAPAAMATTLTVNGTAAMNGSFGMEVVHDNGNVAYVEDLTPADETVYRAEFLFRVASVAFSGSAQNMRQVVVQAIATNPNPGAGVCGGGGFSDIFRIFHLQIVNGTRPSLQMWINGNLCGDRSLGEQVFVDDGPNGGRDLDSDGAVRVCVEFEVNAGTEGGVARFAIVDDGAACTTGTYQTRTVTNSLFAGVDRVRVGPAQLNQFGAGETINYHYDDFASFRTLPN